MPLNFFIKPLTGKFAERTKFAHTVRGIAYHITSPAHLVTPRSRLDFAFALGLASHVRWFADKHQRIDPIWSQMILGECRDWFVRSLGDLDLHSIELAVCSLPAERRYAAALELGRFFELTYQKDHFEREHSTPYTFQQRYHYMQTTDAIPQDVLSKLEMSLASLEASLLAKDPMMPQHLRATHNLLISYPETVHLLDDSEIARIIDAAEVHTKTEIVKATATKSVGTKKKISAGDL